MTNYRINKTGYYLSFNESTIFPLEAFHAGIAALSRFSNKQNRKAKKNIAGRINIPALNVRPLFKEASSNEPNSQSLSKKIAT